MSFKGHFSETLIQRFTQLISTYTGLQIRLSDKKNLCQKIELRMRALKLSQPEAYAQLLESYTPQGEREWQELVLLLTTLESYFFRDQGQITLLRNHILPKLIEQRRQAQTLANSNSKLSLKVWSAGCSTGEEPYSIAILLKELIPDWEQWNLSVIGTDINREALERARQAIYSSWSFRLVNPEIQRQYFNPLKTDWKLNENISKIVNFYSLNLVKDLCHYQDIGIQDIDLIICRNVFVYFGNSAIAAVIKKFYQTLRPGGYLLTGHAELQGQDISFLEAQVFPESVIYRRSENRTINVVPFEETKISSPQITASSFRESTWQSQSKTREQIKNDLQLINTTNLLAQEALKLAHPVKSEPMRMLTPLSVDKTIQETTFQTLLSEAETLFQQKRYPEALSKAKQALTLKPKHLEVYYLIAQLYANLGEYNQAIEYCQKALDIDPLSAIDSYYLLAHIAEEKGDINGAKVFLKRILYLAPSSTYAYLELSFIYEKEGDRARANKMRMIALEMLQKLPHNTVVGTQGNMTAGELIRQVKKILNAQG